MLKPLTALGQDAPVVDRIGPWTLTERADVALASLAFRRGREAELRDLAKGAGLPLPPAARAEAGPVWAAFWMTPEMWMVEAPFASHEDIRAHLVAVFAETASITEQTDAWVRFDLAGAGLERVLERLSNFDLRAAPDGAATRTMIEHLGCYLIRRSAALVTVYGPRSSAGSLHHALVQAAKSVV
ncbi:sarcosine oxidase subunit gamma [bacterium]|nr:sarcosine oxidase subunit gamma [bacterium]